MPKEFNAENEIAKLAADVEVLTQGPMDFEVKKDPHESQESHLGEQASGISSFRYLMRLADLQDFFAAKDYEKAQTLEPGDERNKAYSDARYARKRAASCRYYARKLPRGKAPF